MKKRHLSHLFRIVSIILLVVSVFPLARADTIEQYDSSNQSGDDSSLLGVEFIVGQCFRTTSGGFLNSITLMLKNPTSAGGTYEYRVWSTTGTLGTTCVPSTALGQSQTFIGTTIGTTYSLITKSLITQVLLEANTNYAIGIRMNDFAPVGGALPIVVGMDNTAPTHAGNRVSCSSPFPASCAGDSSIDVIFVASGVLSTSAGLINQCYGNCATLANTNSTSTINFNVTQTIFYKQQITTDGFAVNMTTIVGKSYAVAFGMRLHLGLYATDLSCQSLTTPFTPSCPAFLLRTESFNNPQKGTKTMFLNNALRVGQWVGIAFSASRDGLVLNDTSTNFSSFKTSGIMPSVITQFENNGNLKANLQLNIATNVVTTPIPEIGTTPSLGGWLLDLIDNFAGGNRLAGGIFWFFAFSLGIIVGIPLALQQRDIEMPSGSMGMLIPFIFVGVSTLFTSLGALPAWIPILLFVIVAWLFAGTITKRQ